MKDQLQLHEIVWYLPYGLQIKILNHKSDYVGIEYAKVNGYYFIADQLHVTYEGGSTGKDVSIFRPVLRPLSDLEREITTIRGENIVPIEWMEDFYDTHNFHDQCRQLMDDNRWLNHLDYLVVQHLFEWHFDVRDLIGRNLAVSIYSINK